MASAILGQPFIFNVRFLDGSNQPILATGVMVKVFRFEPPGGEVVLAVAPMSAVPGDLGRFQYSYTVPLGLAAGGMIYGTMYGTDPLTLGTLTEEVGVQLVAPPVPGHLIARFIP